MTISEPPVRGVLTYADGRAVLEHPLLVPEPAAESADAVVGSLAWLRATVARFTGDASAHARRRAHAEAGLAGLDPRELRRAAAGSAVGVDDRHTVVRILAEALGLPGADAVADAVVAVSAGYFGGELTPVEAKAADEAVASLLARVADGEDPEAAAQRIGLLVQACDATARLVEHARRAAPGGLPAGGAEAVLGEVLRQDPPVTALRRRAVADVRVGALELRSGEAVVVDVTAAQQDAPLLVFGAGPHRCPGQAHALALAAGLLERDDPAAHAPSSPNHQTAAATLRGAEMTPATPAATTAFRELHHRPGEPLLLPNAWDHASAAALAAAGFAAIGTTSLGVAAAAGLPDGTGRTRAAMLRLAHRLGGGAFLLSVDIEGGFSDDPAEVADLATEFAEAGAVGLNLEDGRADGGLTPTHLHAAKITAIKAAVPRLFVNARTDTHWLREGDTAETASRLAAYQDAGADGVFVPGLSDPASVAAAVAATALPLNVLATPGGPSLASLADLGVRRVSLGGLLFRVALGAAVDTAVSLRTTGALPPMPHVPGYAAVQALTD